MQGWLVGDLAPVLARNAPPETGDARLAALRADGRIPVIAGIAGRRRMAELKDAERHWDSLLPKPVCRASARRVLRDALRRR